MARKKKKKKSKRYSPITDMMGGVMAVGIGTQAIKTISTYT